MHMLSPSLPLDPIYFCLKFLDSFEYLVSVCLFSKCMLLGNRFFFANHFAVERTVEKRARRLCDSSRKNGCAFSLTASTTQYQQEGQAVLPFCLRWRDLADSSTLLARDLRKSFRSVFVPRAVVLVFPAATCRSTNAWRPLACCAAPQPCLNCIAQPDAR